MKLGFYPGCSLKGGSREYKESVQAVCKAFDIELVEIPDWSCCGASAAHNLNKDLALSLPARILALAEEAGLDDIVVPCAACYSRLSVTQHELNEHPDMRERVSGIIQKEYKGSSNILNIIQVIEKYMLPNLSFKQYQQFNYKAASYYGCLLVRPNSILKFDREEDPRTMDNVIHAIGGTPVEWEFKTECCGAGHSVSRTDLVGKLSARIVKDAVNRGAECIVVACPMCHSNLDMRRPEINKFMDTPSDIPVLYLIQAIGLAVGLSAKELGLPRHFVPVNLPERPVDYTLHQIEEVVVTKNTEE